MIRVFIVEDHPVMRQSLRTLLGREDDLHVCGEAPTGEEALQQIASEQPDLVLVDVSLPGMNGIQLVRALQQQLPGVAVAMLSGHGGAAHVDQALREARAAVRIDDTSADALGMLALVQMVRGNAEEAGRHYAAAARHAPNDGAVQNNYGAWLCREGRAAESMEYFERALAASGNQQPADALANAGACAEAAGRGDRAESYLRAALRLDPENSVALSAMAEYQYRSGRYLEARAFSQRRLAAAPPSADVLLLASQIEEKMGDMAAAERYRQRLGREFPQALQQNPGG